MTEKSHKVKVYSTKTCPYCVMVKEYLKSHKINYEDVDVGSDRKAAMEMVSKSGQMGVPVIEIDNNIIVGYNKEAIRRLLSIKE